MGNIQKFYTQDLDSLMDKIVKNSVGMDDYFQQFFNYDTSSNYPPYNHIQLNNVDSLLEIALACFSKKEIHVYTEYGRLIVEGKKEEKEGNPSMSIKDWLKDLSQERGALSEDIEVREVQFKDGLLTVKLGKVVPDHHARKDYL